jgi:hypothetical protein
LSQENSIIDLFLDAHSVSPPSRLCDEQLILRWPLNSFPLLETSIEPLDVQRIAWGKALRNGIT